MISVPLECRIGGNEDLRWLYRILGGRTIAYWLSDPPSLRHMIFARLHDSVDHPLSLITGSENHVRSDLSFDFMHSCSLPPDFRLDP